MLSIVMLLCSYCSYCSYCKYRCYKYQKENIRMDYKLKTTTEYYYSDW